jgi:acetyl-CoA synthetase
MTDRIETLLDEQRSFAPPAAFRQSAHVRDQSVYDRARADREGYWADWARQLEWIRPWDRVLEWKPPHAQWFVGGKLNVSANCLDRHVRGGKKDKAALIWEGEPGEVRRITYGELLRDVCRCANVLKGLGVRKGDRVAIYLPMVPEVAVAMQACARIGAVHTVVFGGFSAESLRDRIIDAQAQVLITADGGYRRGAVVPLKQNADDAVAQTPSIRHVMVLKRTGQSGGTISCRPPRRSARPSRWMRRIPSSFSIPPAPPASPRAFSIPPADISRRRMRRPSGCSI